MLNDKADQSVTPRVFSISATYSFGEKSIFETTTIDLQPYKESIHPPSVIADELKKIREQLEGNREERLRSNNRVAALDYLGRSGS